MTHIFPHEPWTCYFAAGQKCNKVIKLEYWIWIIIYKLYNITVNMCSEWFTNFITLQFLYDLLEWRYAALSLERLSLIGMPHADGKKTDIRMLHNLLETILKENMIQVSCLCFSIVIHQVIHYSSFQCFHQLFHS